MSDIYEKVSGEQDFIKKILAKIPGFKGYIERGDRRMSDKLLREQVALEFETLYGRVSALQRDLISQGGLEYVDDLEAAAIKLRQFIDRVKTASYGYSAIFDALKIKEDKLAQAYEYDACRRQCVSTRDVKGVRARSTGQCIINQVYRFN